MNQMKDWVCLNAKVYDTILAVNGLSGISAAAYQYRNIVIFIVHFLTFFCFSFSCDLDQLLTGW